MTDLSPAAQAVLDSVLQVSNLSPSVPVAAAALRALTRAPFVDEAQMRGWIVYAIATEDLLDLAYELENHND